MVWDDGSARVPVSSLGPGQVAAIYAVAAALMGAYEAGARGCSSFALGMVTLGLDIVSGDWGAAVAGAQAAAACVERGFDGDYVDDDGHPVYE